MENFKICLNAVLPLLIIMAAGYTAKCARFLNVEDVPRFNNLAFRIFMPCLVFYNIYSSDLSASVRPALILFTIVCVFSVFLATLLFVLATEKLPERRGVMIQGIYRSNFVVIGMPISTALAGGESLGSVALLIAIIVPIYNVLAVITLAVFCGRKISIRETLLSIVGNPLIIGTGLGILAQLLQISLPTFLFEAIKDLGMGATPLQLLLLGAFFHFSGMGKYRRSLAAAVLGRLVVIPGIILFIAIKMGFRGAEFVSLLGCFSSSTAIASFTMTQQMGGDAELAGDIVVLTSALCPVSIFCWALLFKSMGIY